MQGPLLHRQHARQRDGQENRAGDEYQAECRSKIGMTRPELFQRQRTPPTSPALPRTMAPNAATMIAAPSRRKKFKAPVAVPS